jgi:hypothetical protein
MSIANGGAGEVQQGVVIGGNGPASRVGHLDADDRRGPLPAACVLEANGFRTGEGAIEQPPPNAGLAAQILNPIDAQAE